MSPIRPPHGSLLGLLALLLVASQLRAGPVRTGLDSDALPANDDESAGASVGFSLNFFGQTFSQVFVNNNGNITFGAALEEFTPFDLADADLPIIAPFFADVDTTGGGSVRYGTGMVDGRKAFAATWTDVGYYDANADKTNTFQVVLIDRGDVKPGDFDVEFNYDRIEWETGDFSGGVEGLGGESARVGFANGTAAPGTSFELPGSAVHGAFLDGGPSATALAFNSLNSDVEGRYVFYARDGVLGTDPDGEPPPPVDPGEPPSVPEPATLLLAGAGLAGLAGYRRLRRQRI